MQAQMHDSIGILKSMYRLNPKSDVFQLVMESAESFSMTGIKRCSLLNENQRKALLERASTPTPLKHLTRMKVRCLVGGHGPYVLEKIADLPIPEFIQRYLLYEVR